MWKFQVICSAFKKFWLFRFWFRTKKKIKHFKNASNKVPSWSNYLYPLREYMKISEQFHHPKKCSLKKTTLLNQYVPRYGQDLNHWLTQQHIIRVCWFFDVPNDHYQLPYPTIPFFSNLTIIWNRIICYTLVALMKVKRIDKCGSLQSHRRERNMHNNKYKW